MTQYFQNVKTLDELKKQYRRLAMQWHPDAGGDTATMQAINAEHDHLFELLKEQHNAAADEYHQTTEAPHEFRDIIDFLIKFGDLEVVLVGSWLWVGGNTKAHKDELKAAGFRWSQNKSRWYWHHPEPNHKWRRGKSTMDEIRQKYGSQTFTGSREDSRYEKIGAAC